MMFDPEAEFQLRQHGSRKVETMAERRPGRWSLLVAVNFIFLGLAVAVLG